MTSLSTTLPRISSSTAPPAAPEVLSNPVSALAVPNGKSIQNCTELHLTHSSITKLAGFDRFENLDTLWLNNNNLVRVSGLDENSRIQRLYLNNNNLVSLRGFENCTFLNVLSAHTNSISDLHSVLAALSSFHHISELDLHANPICEETNYRLLVIKHMPSVAVLDRHKVTDEERQIAKTVKTVEELMAAEALLGDGGSSGSKELIKTNPSQQQLDLQKCLQTGLTAVSRCVTDNRILLKAHFMEEDPRREWVVADHVFDKYMGLYGLDEVAMRHTLNGEVLNDTTSFNLTSTTNPPAASSNAHITSYTLMHRKFSTRSPPPRAATMGRDASLQLTNDGAGTAFIDYVKFCMAVEPNFNSRDLDNVERAAKKERAVRLGPTVDDKVPLSNTVKGLNNKVKAYQKGLAQKAQDERREMAQLSEVAVRKQRAMRVPMAKSEEDFQTPENQLDAWELNELMTLITKSKSYNSKTHAAAKKDLRTSLDDMVLCGKKMVFDDIVAFLEEEKIARDKLKEFEDEMFGEEKKEDEKLPLERFFDEIAENKEGEYSVKTFIEDVYSGVNAVPPPTWRGVTHAEAKFKAKELYKKASQLQQRVALMGDDDPVMKKNNTLQIKELTTFASRLEKIATGEPKHSYMKQQGPRRVMRGDNVTVKTMSERVKEVEWDEGLSDDEEEGREEDDTDEGWAEKVKERETNKAEQDVLQKKIGVSEEMQGRYRQVLHTRRAKNIEVGTARLVTNYAVFERDS